MCTRRKTIMNTKWLAPIDFIHKYFDIFFLLCEISFLSLLFAHLLDSQMLRLELFLPVNHKSEGWISMIRSGWVSKWGCDIFSMRHWSKERMRKCLQKRSMMCAALASFHFVQERNVWICSGCCFFSTLNQRYYDNWKKWWAIREKLEMSLLIQINFKFEFLSIFH